MELRANFMIILIVMVFIINTSASSSGDNEERRDVVDEKQNRVEYERRFTGNLYYQGDDDWKKEDHFQPTAIPISEDQIVEDDDRRYYARKPDVTYDDPFLQAEWFSNPGRKSGKNSLLKGGMEFFQKHMATLLIAYKLKFFTLIPLMVAGLLLVVGSTGLAGFFFALFAAAMGLRVGGAQN